MKRRAGLKSTTGFDIFTVFHKFIPSYKFFSEHLVLQDDNRYNAGRGAHLILKRAEKARALVNKLPGML